MNSFVIILASIVAAITAYPVHEDYHGPSNYKFNYGVSDPHTGDHKEQHEVRHGHIVHGSYSLAEPDGTHRIVEYSSGPHSGFNAVVKKIGKSIHPPTYHHGHNIYNSGAGQLHGYHGHWDAHSHVGTTHWGHY